MFLLKQRELTLPKSSEKVTQGWVAQTVPRPLLRQEPGSESGNLAKNNTVMHRRGAINSILAAYE
jgi:hypothetical protein